MRNEWLILFLLCFTISASSCKEDVSSNEEALPSIEGLVWSDEFNGVTWDKAKWYPELGDNGWGNNEWQNYTPFNRNIEVSNGTLKSTLYLKEMGNELETILLHVC